MFVIIFTIVLHIEQLKKHEGKIYFYASLHNEFVGDGASTSRAELNYSCANNQENDIIAPMFNQRNHFVLSFS